MKSLVKVIEAEYLDAAEFAIIDLTRDFLVNARILVNEAELMSYELKSPVSLRIDNNVGEYFMVRRQDLPSRVGVVEKAIALSRLDSPGNLVAGLRHLA